MGNEDRTRNQGTPNPGETQDGSEKERSRETQGGGELQPSQPQPTPSGVPNEGRGVERAGSKSGDEDEEDGGSEPTERGTAGSPDETPPKQYVGGKDEKPE